MSRRTIGWALAGLVLGGLWAGGKATALATRRSSVDAAEAESVFLIHGMGRTRWSMLVLGERLKRAGYRVCYFSYPTPSPSLHKLTGELLATLEHQAKGRTYHLVGHSLGNVIIRDGFRTGYPDGLGRVVMLAPPNRPAALARKLADNPLFQTATGDFGRRLADPQFYASLPVPTVPFAVIAGTRSHTGLFGEPSDGVVEAAATRLEGMASWHAVEHTHTFIMNTGDVFELTSRFLAAEDSPNPVH